MPLYEYRCAKCQTVFEVIQKFSDQPLKKHQGCGGKVERLVSASALQFKGSGWYVNDYARNSGKSKDGAEGSSEAKPAAESKSESKPAAKGDSKPAAKSETKPAPAASKSE